MRVQQQVEQRWLSRLRRDVREIEHLRYVHVFPLRPQLKTFVVEGDIGDCPVCLKTFEPGEKFTVLPCNPTHPHRFHTECIRPWLRHNDTCPTCRGRV